MEKFRQFISRLSSFKRIALLSFFCLVLQAIVFVLGFIACFSIIRPNSPTMFDESANSAGKFLFYVVPVIVFFSAFISSLTIFWIISPKKIHYSPALLVAAIQFAPLIITIPFSLLLTFYGLNFMIAAAPVYLLFPLSVIAGNILFSKLEKSS